MNLFFCSSFLVHLVFALIWKISLAKCATSAQNVTVDNESSSISYSGTWTVQDDTVYDGGSISYATNPGDSFSFHFNGTGIQYFGPSTTNGAKFQVSIDGKHVGTCTSGISSTGITYHNILWTNETVSPTIASHVFTITHNDTAGRHLSIDKLTYVTTGPSSPVANQDTASSSSSLPSSTEMAQSSDNIHMKTSTIVGVVFAVIISVALLLFFIVWWIKRQNRRTAHGISPTNNSAYNVSNGVGAIGGLSRRLTRMWSTRTVGGRGRGRGERESTTPMYYDQEKQVIPHLYNSYASTTSTSHQMSSLKGDPFNPVIATGSAVPYQIPLNSNGSPSSPTQRSRTTSQTKPLPPSPAKDNSPSREVDFTSPVTGAVVYSHPFSANYTPSSAPNPNANSNTNANPFSSTGGFGHYLPYAPYAQDYARPSTSARPSFDRRASGSASSLRLDTGKRLEDVRGDLSLRQTMSADGEGSNSRQMHPLTHHNNSSTSLSYYPDATSADGIARSYSQTILARPESRSSSISSKRFSNQLFTR